MSDTACDIAVVALNVPVRRTFDYRVPPELRGAVRVGCRVSVPFGRRARMQGVCVELRDRSAFPRLKDISGLVDKEPLFDERMMALTRWMADYYACSWGEALAALLPAGAVDDADATLTFVRAAATPQELRAEAARIEVKARVQARVLRVLADATGEIALAALCREARAHAGVVAALEKRQLLQRRRRKVEHDPFQETPAEREAPLTPTEDQQAALDRILPLADAARFQVVLLNGVTASGKTEVYLRALERVVAGGRQGIVLVPEISLTPQTVRRFRARFERVAVLHSNLTAGQRRAQWRRIRAGKADVVVGARSAVFAPVPSLGLLVVDEEHENSFKQDKAPRYHARDVGIWRARQADALVILGSATPSLESFHNACLGKYLRIDLPRRVQGLSLPGVDIVNLREAAAEAKRLVILSRRLRSAVQSALDRGEQVILFLNRRGFATSLLCPGCGNVLKCRHCDVALTYHRAGELARCHYCRHEIPAPDRCPVCGRPDLKRHGLGTQRVEEHIREAFPAAVVARMDSDSMRGVGRHEAVLERFRRGEVHILLGTQMIAQGLDFPNVTVVGVLNADTSLNLPDFRASERTFQLLAQVAGRAGRGERGGRVFVQTFTPEHECIRAAAAQDFGRFAEAELDLRRRFGYPPFCRLARIVCEAKDPRNAEAVASSIAEALRHATAGGPVTVLGPAPAPLALLRGRHRWHVCLKAPDAAALHQALAASSLPAPAGVQVITDVDPMTML